MNKMDEKEINVEALLDDTEEILEEDKEIKTYKEKGRGRKQCRHCKAIVGVRNKYCICGKKFVKKENQPKPQDPKLQETIELNRSVGLYGGKVIVYTPSGKCPVKLKGDVIAWVINLMGYMESQGRILSLSAIIYWLGKFHAPYTEKYKKYSKRIKSWYQEQIGANNETNQN